MKKKRPTIGLFVTSVTEEIGITLCQGALQQAIEEDVNLIVFPGKYPGFDYATAPTMRYEYQYNPLYAFATKENVDALVIAAGNIDCFMKKGQLKQFLDTYRDIPCVLLSEKPNGFPAISFDNKQGIEEGLEEFLRQGCTRIGMIGGNMENNDARERKETFVHFLSEHGIPFEERRYVDGDFSGMNDQEGETLLDQNSDLQAVFCANDVTALNFYKAAEKRGLKIGKDILVFGYDDTIMGVLSTPPLASVRADTGILVQEAIRMAVRMIHGEKVDSIVLPTHFVRRESAYSEELAKEIIQDIRMDEDTSFDNIYHRYIHGQSTARSSELRDSFHSLLTVIQNQFLPSADKKRDYQEVVSALDHFIEVDGLKFADVDSLLAVLDNLRKRILETLTEDSDRFHLNNSFSYLYRRIIREMNKQMGLQSQRKDEENYEMKLFVQEIQQLERGSDQSFRTMLENLNWLEISNACIYTLEKPVIRFQDDSFVLPEKMYLKAVLRNHVIQPVAASETSPRHLFSNGVLPEENRYYRVLLPLFSKENFFGFLYCDMTKGLYTNAGFLVNQLGSALKMLSLLQTNETTQQRLEETAATLKENNIELDIISRVDLLTGILNRRGFQEEAEQLLNSLQASGDSALVVYVDMNNLKIVNDRYGHEEGDFSLKLIGTFLKELATGRGITGRIGGDEYACILRNETEEAFLTELYGKFDTFNESSEKPYQITVSAGALVLEPGNFMPLKTALLHADEKLYEVKKYRKKEIVKEKR